MTEPHLRFVARLGAAMCAAQYPVTLVRQMLVRSATSYQEDTDFIVLPNHVQVVGSAGDAGSIVKAVHAERALRFDQMFPLTRLVSSALAGRTAPADGLAELDRLMTAPPPYRAWVRILGHGILSTGFALLLEPTALNVLLAMVLGLLVGSFWIVGQRFSSVSVLVPATSAFVVTTICILGAHQFALDHLGLRALIPPLAMFLPGSAITLSVIELTSRDVVSGSSRLIAGFIDLVQLAFGILIAVQLLGMQTHQLSALPLNKLGPWAPWLGVLVYAVGVMLFLAPPRSVFPWLLAIAYAGYLGQFLGDRALGSYASGFCGGVVLTLAALIVSRHPSAPSAITLILPGFWLLVPGSIGLIGITEMFGAEGDSALPATLISMISVAFGLQTGLALWSLIRGLRD